MLLDNFAFTGDLANLNDLAFVECLCSETHPFQLSFTLLQGNLHF